MKIGELAGKARCLAVTIRYYEKMGLLPNEKRDASNHRIYDEEDGERLRFILHCRNHKIPIQGIRKLLDMRDGCGKENMEAARLLRSHIRALKLQREATDRLIESLTAILDGIDGSLANDDEVISALGSLCPHCPDYEEKIGKGRKMYERARFLASPAKR